MNLSDILKNNPSSFFIVKNKNSHTKSMIVDSNINDKNNFSLK